MSSIVESVHEVTAAAAAVLPGVEQVGSFADAELTAALAALGALRDRVEASLACCAAEADRRSARDLGAAGLAQQHGVKDAAGLVQKFTGSSLAQAKKAVRVGGLLEAAHAVAPMDGEPVPAERDVAVLTRLPGPWDAPIAVCVRNRWLSADQGDALRAGLGAPRDDASTPLFRQAVLDLITDCWECNLTAEELKKAAQRLRALLDRRWAQANAERLYELRSATRRIGADGMVDWHLRLDPESDAQLWTPIFRRLSPRLGGPRFMSESELARAKELQQDGRSNEQLVADELVALVVAGVNAEPTRFGQYVPRVNVAVTSAELRRARHAESVLTAHHAGVHSGCPAVQPLPAESGTPGSSGTPRACPGPDPGIAWLEDSGAPVTGLTALRMICDGGRLAALFDDTGHALDVTSDERTFSPRQRRALALRDGGCLWPGCTMPPGACEAHHVNPWHEGPQNHKTEVRDGVLLCKFHHLLLHNHGARISRSGSVYTLHWHAEPPVRLGSKSALRTQLRHDGELR